MGSIVRQPRGFSTPQHSPTASSLQARPPLKIRLNSRRFPPVFPPSLSPVQTNPFFLGHHLLRQGTYIQWKQRLFPSIGDFTTILALLKTEAKASRYNRSELEITPKMALSHPRGGGENTEQHLPRPLPLKVDVRLLLLELLHHPHHLMPVQVGDLPDLRIRQTSIAAHRALPQHPQDPRLRRLPVDPPVAVRAATDAQRAADFLTGEFVPVSSPG